MAPFDIEVRRNERLIHATIRGFWTDAIALDYEVATREALATTGSGRGWSYLCDARDYPVQAGPLVNRAHELINEVAARCDGRVAVVLEAGLASLQAKRVLGGQAAPVFASLDEARRPLAPPTSATAPQSP